jgi:hypothetical protein
MSFAKYYYRDRMKEDERGRGYSMHRRKGTCARSSGRKHTEGKRTLGRPRRRFEDMKIDLKEVGMGSVHWIYRAQDRDQWRALMKTVIRFRVPSNAGNYLSS